VYNDIQSVLQNAKMTMFADDKALYCHEDSLTNLQSKLNADLAAITSWLHNNKLTLNVTKSKFTITGGRNKLSQFNDMALVANINRSIILNFKTKVSLHMRAAKG